MITNISKVLFGLWLVSIITASLINYSDISSIDISTKGSAGLGYHFFGYFIGAVLLWIVLKRSGLKAITTGGVLLFLLSLILELIQMFVPYRTFNPMDIAANAFGLGAFYICLAIWMAYSPRRRQER